MKLPKKVIFDVGGTILKNIDFSLEKGINYLFYHVFEASNYADFVNYCLDIHNLVYGERIKNSIEVPFMSYISMINLKYEFKKDIKIDDIEINYRKSLYKIDLVDNIKDLLDFFKRHNIDMYVFSNSTFSSDEVKSELDSFNLSHYFKKIVASGSFYYRKPSVNVFKILLKSFEDECINNEDIWYIGNEVENDILSTKKLGIKGILINDQISSTEAYQNINNYKELLEILND